MALVRMAARRSCRCGHGKEAHRHYRRGSECASRGCDCPRYQGAAVLVVALRTPLPAIVPAVRAVTPLPPVLVTPPVVAAARVVLRWMRPRRPPDEAPPSTREA